MVSSVVKGRMVSSVVKGGVVWFLCIAVKWSGELVWCSTVQCGAA